MKNNKVEKAVGVIINEQKNLAIHVAHLNESEKRRALMSVASFSATAGYRSVMNEAIKLLGFRDEEVLIFAMATIAGGRPQMVSHIVRAFCRNTAVARSVLGDAARKMISWAERAQEPTHLLEAIECVRLRNEKIGEEKKDFPSDNQSTILAGFILWLADDFIQKDPIHRDTYDIIVAELRNLVPDDKRWEYLQKRKSRMGGPRRA